MNTIFAMFFLGAGCVQKPEEPVQEPTRPLTASEMEAQLRAAVQAIQPAAQQEALRVVHHALETREISSPFQHHRCWAFRVGADPLDGSPDMAYGCISDQGDVHYPYTEADFNTMLSREDHASWSAAEYGRAAQLYIHLQHVIHQDAGWVVLESAADFMAIDFNMQSESVDARESLGQQIHPVQYRDQTVHLFTWTVIGGALQQWAISFQSGTVIAQATELGRFGGGGYD